MKFNLLKERLDNIKKSCRERIRLEDLDGLPSGRLSALCQKIKKQAAHGMGDSWSEMSQGQSPYNTSPSVNATPEYGGRWRENFPDGGDHHINDDRNKEKSTSGRTEDFDPKIKKLKLNEKLKLALEPISSDTFILRVQIIDKQDPEKLIMALGEGAKYDGRYVSQRYMTFEEALKWQRIFRGSIVETNPK